MNPEHPAGRGRPVSRAFLEAATAACRHRCRRRRRGFGPRPWRTPPPSTCGWSTPTCPTRPARNCWRNCAEWASPPPRSPTPPRATKTRMPSCAPRDSPPSSPNRSTPRRGGRAARRVADGRGHACRRRRDRRIRRPPAVGRRDRACRAQRQSRTRGRAATAVPRRTARPARADRRSGNGDRRCIGCARVAASSRRGWTRRCGPCRSRRRMRPCSACSTRSGTRSLSRRRAEAGSRHQPPGVRRPPHDFQPAPAGGAGTPAAARRRLARSRLPVRDPRPGPAIRCWSRPRRGRAHRASGVARVRDRARSAQRIDRLAVAIGVQRETRSRVRPARRARNRRSVHATGSPSPEPRAQRMERAYARMDPCAARRSSSSQA